MLKERIRTVILAAEVTEYKLCSEMFPEYECVLMGVGAGNVIKTCSQLPHGTRVINIGYAGSNSLSIGTVSMVKESHRYTDGVYQFADYANPLPLSANGYPCYTSNSFVTSTQIVEPTLFDMELNYIAAFTPCLDLVASIKVVSDNLSVEAFTNNAIRESGILTSKEVWDKVRALFEVEVMKR